MKKLLVLFAVSAVMSTSVSASHYGGMLSPGLRNLSEDVCLVKSGLVSGEIRFSSDDFRRSLGGTVDSLTVTALPPSSAGTLFCGDAPVTVNQMLAGESLENLRFVPARDCVETSFRVKSGGEYSVECVLRYTDAVNLAPVVDVTTSSGVWTQRDITVFSSLSATDPEGDPLTFEIVRYPENGILTLTNPATGDYRYTPCDGVTGEDSFTYVVRDEWGNYSEEASVVIEVERAATELVFADMEGHWAHNAALVTVAEGSMEAETVGSAVYFRPDEGITREEFLVTVMKSLGAGEAEPCATVFADHAEMAPESTGYIARAYNLGIIRGTEEGGEVWFRPTAGITRAEAAVVLNAIIGAEEPDAVAVFADDSAVPVWARGSLYALSEAGILTGTGAGNLSPNAELSRGQTAQVLLTVKQYLNNR